VVGPLPDIEEGMFLPQNFLFFFYTAFVCQKDFIGESSVVASRLVIGWVWASSWRIYGFFHTYLLG
jgi:hypothetical protein